MLFMKIIFRLILILILVSFVYIIYTTKVPLLQTFIPKQTSAICKDCNVMLISIDSCAAKNIPCYGYQRDTMPNFCKFASENVLFKNMYANAPWTLPSHVSIFTGLFPSNHHVNKVFTDVLDPKIPLLTDVFNQNGYETIFYMPKHNEILSDTIIYNRGMTRITDNVGKPDEDIDGALDLLRENIESNKKTFLTFYSQQCHYPYLLNGKPLLYSNDIFPEIPTDKNLWPIPFTEKFYQYLLETSKINMDKSKDVDADSYKFYKLIFDGLSTAGNFSLAKKNLDSLLTNPSFNKDLYRAQYFEYYYALELDPNNKRKMEYVRALYDQTLHNLDSGLIRKIASAFSNSSEISKSTILLITSEHGEEFGEHGIFGHTSLYNLNLNVPLLLHIPGILPQSISDDVQSVDIMPTLLELVGIQHSFGFDGLSLVPLLHGKHLPTRVIVADNYLTPQLTKSIQYSAWKVFVSATDELSPYLLFNLKNDRNEKSDVLSQHFSVANDLIEMYKKSQSNNVSKN